jgi:putative transposase
MESLYRRHRFPPEIISHAVWLYHRFTLSFRDVEDLLAERGITVSYEAIRSWCRKFGPEYARTLRRRQGPLGDIWHVDEVFVTIRVERHYLWRAVDQDGDVLDSLVTRHRDKRAAKRFFRKVLKHQERPPLQLITDRLRTYPAAHREVFPSVTHQTGQYVEQWIDLAKEQSKMIPDSGDLAERLRFALATSWPEKVSAKSEEGRLVLSRVNREDYLPARWVEGNSGIALVIHEGGSAEVEKTEVVRKLRAEGKSLLLLDVFQTGAARESRNYTYRQGRREQGYHITFNRSDDANRVQDVLTALAYLHGKSSGRIELIGLGKAAVWTLFATAVAPKDVNVQLYGDLAGFQGTDDEFIDQMFVPGIQRAGGLATAQRLAEYRLGVVR